MGRKPASLSRDSSLYREVVERGRERDGRLFDVVGYHELEALLKKET